jgi:DNA-binding MarR family transcriptional regulator
VDESAAGGEVWRAIADLFFSAENQQRFMDAADELGLSPPMLKALTEIEPGESQPMRSLAEQWGCDASFVTVVVDGLEQAGYARRLVAPHDRRVKTVELTDEGVAARDQALDRVYGPRSGYWDLDPDERITLAVLLRKLADAQSIHDDELVDSGRAQGLKHRVGPPIGHRGRGGRAGGGRPGGGRGARGERSGNSERTGSGERWRDHLDAHREELRRLRDEVARVRDEVRAQARRPAGELWATRSEVVDELKSARDDVKAEIKAELEAAKSDAKAELKAARADATAEVRSRIEGRDRHR